MESNQMMTQKFLNDNGYYVSSYNKQPPPDFQKGDDYCPTANEIIYAYNMMDITEPLPLDPTKLVPSGSFKLLDKTLVNGGIVIMKTVEGNLCSLKAILYASSLGSSLYTFYFTIYKNGVFYRRGEIGIKGSEIGDVTLIETFDTSNVIIYQGIITPRNFKDKPLVAMLGNFD